MTGGMVKSMRTPFLRRCDKCHHTGHNMYKVTFSSEDPIVFWLCGSKCIKQAQEEFHKKQKVLKNTQESTNLSEYDEIMDTSNEDNIDAQGNGGEL